MEQVITQLAVKILFDDYSVLFMRWEDNYFTREAEIIIDFVYVFRLYDGSNLKTYLLMRW